MDKQEASSTLNDIEQSQARMRARAQYKGADAIYALWGVIWFIAFTCQQAGGIVTWRVGEVSFTGGGILWTPLVLIGIVATFIIARRRIPVRDKQGHKQGLLWPIVFGYFYLWMFLLGPLFNHELLATEEGMLHGTAVISTIPMCVYVLIGLVSGESYIAWVGGVVTVLTAAGMVLFHDYFYIWMAVVGGGGLMLAGYISNRKWRLA